MKYFICDCCGGSFKFYDCAGLVIADERFTLCWPCVKWVMGKMPASTVSGVKPAFLALRLFKELAATGK